MVALTDVLAARARVPSLRTFPRLGDLVDLLKDTRNETCHGRPPGRTEEEARQAFELMLEAMTWLSKNGLAEFGSAVDPLLRHPCHNPRDEEPKGPSAIRALPITPPRLQARDAAVRKR